METLKEKLRKYNQVKDLFYTLDLDVEKKSIYAKVLKSFIEWAKNPSMDNPEFTKVVTFEDNLLKAHAVQESMSELGTHLKNEGFYVTVIGEVKGTKITVAFSSPEEIKKHRDELRPALEKMKERMKDSLFNSVQHSLNNVFESHCCKQNQVYYEHPASDLFEDMCLKLYKKHFKKFANRKKLNEYCSSDCDSISEKLSDLILFKPMGKYTLIEAFKKGKEKTLKV